MPAAVSAQALDLEALLATEEAPLPPAAALSWDDAVDDQGSLPLFKAPEPAPAAASSSCFTPEELAIIEEQRRAAAAPAVKPPPDPAPRPSWVEVLRSFGESLTDSELQIIRRQLAT